MATISFQVTETGQTTATKTYTLPDGHVDRLVVAFQAAANVAIGGTATRAQVLNTWSNMMINDTINYVANVEQQTAFAAVAQATPITPV